MKKNVLVFPCGSEVGLEIHKSLRYSTHFDLIGGSSVDDHGSFVYKNYIGGLPRVDNPKFISEINDIVRQRGIDYIFPAHDSVVLALAMAKASGELACDLITSPFETCDIARSKLKTYQHLALAIATPKIFTSIDELQQEDFPIFLKPDVGQGSKGTYTINTKDEAQFYAKQDPSLLMLEYLPGKEYTVDCFTNKDGQLLFSEARERVRITNGISVRSATINDERFAKIAAKVNQQLTFRGVWFLQLKERSNGELVLMEIAPRVAGTMGLVRAKGVNLPLLSLFDAENINVGIFENLGSVIIDRALQNSYKHDLHYEHVYLDFDDLVIFEESINPTVMAFVYQCKNKRIQTHLITRHKHELEVSLQKYHLADIFDEVIWLQNGEAKHEFIKERRAIFIDDSFAERKKVHDNLGIPVFDAHMIESLIEF
jgi:hypothetical protein